jgi:hypothetical protein
MPKRPLNLSLEEIQREAAEEIRWLEEVAAQHQSRDWPRALLPLAREFHSLAAGSPLDSVQIADFTIRLAAHIKQKGLKGFEPFLWRAEELGSLASKRKNA